MSKYGNEVNKYLLRIKKGDRSEDALRDLVDYTANHLAVVAKIYLYNKADAYDVAVDAYQKAYKYIDSFDVHRDGYNWLCKITQRIAYNYNEKNYNLENFDDSQLPSKEYKDLDEDIDLSNALNNLDKESKKVIIMYYYMGYTLEEIGIILGKGKTSVHKQIKRILKRIKVYL